MPTHELVIMGLSTTEGIVLLLEIFFNTTLSTATVICEKLTEINQNIFETWLGTNH